MSTILVVDDEPQILRALQINLHAHGYQVLTASTGAQALTSAAKYHPDAVVLDLGLPDIDGQAVIEGLRGWTSVPILVLSARHSSEEKVQALDAGADDYVTKPFALDEFLARLRVALRRTVYEGNDPVVTTDDFAVDLAAHKVIRDGEQIKLTPTEFSLLQVLVRNQGVMVSQSQLLTTVWGPAYAAEAQYLRVYMGQLRKKLESDPAHPKHLITEPGVGYRFEP